MADRPLIGITLDYQEKGTFSQRPHYAVRTIYFAAVEAAGGLPIAIPHLADRLPEYMKMIDGLVIPGGTHASPESWYVDLHEPPPYEETPRAAFDIAVVEQALKRDMPLLGICAGMQELACVAGAKMTRNVHKHYKTEIDHRQGMTADRYAHDVTVEPGTRLAQIVGAGKIEVNTAHQEAVVSVPKDMTISARSPDGVIEAIELPKHKFALGVQWHPEFFLAAGNPHRKVFEALVAAAKS
ncbi:MAG: gamma-glutamyl-gamma-aminobutyrate hydrolase family protein [Alphaproteobacteria bacterium]|nr:gamma-glutamyl-gamma-aminobutyrate hydrolase family protein [Alphaproteobacteria bacterium]